MLADPARDLPRLVLADWLDESGGPDGAGYAQFIRLQLEHRDWFDGPPGGPDSYSDSAPPGCGPALDWLSRSSDRHLLAAFPGWSAKRVKGNYPWVRRLRSHWGDAELQVVWGRGFLAEVRCTLAQWLESGGMVVARQPVERVRVTNRTPFGVGGVSVRRWYWHRYVPGYYCGDYALPDEVFAALSGGTDGAGLDSGAIRTYDSDPAARSDLSAALLALARG